MFYSFIESGKYVAYLFSGQIPVGGKQIIRRESDLYSFRYRGYEGFRRYVEKRFGTGPEIVNINQDFTNRFVSAIDEDYGKSESMRRFMISRYNAVVNFGRDSGLIPKGVKIALPPYYLLPANRNLTGEEKDEQNIVQSLYEPEYHGLFRQVRYLCCKSPH